MTKQLLWQEYKEGTPDGFQYSQFCANYQEWGTATVGDDAHVGRPGVRDGLHEVLRRTAVDRQRHEGSPSVVLPPAPQFEPVEILSARQK